MLEEGNDHGRKEGTMEQGRYISRKEKEKGGKNGRSEVERRTKGRLERTRKGKTGEMVHGGWQGKERDVEKVREGACDGRGGRGREAE